MSIGRLRSMYPELKEEEFQNLLWEWTAYPMGKPETIIKQFSSKIRAIKNKRKVCWFCSYDTNYGHKKWCPNYKKCKPISI